MELVLIIGFAVLWGSLAAKTAERKGYDRSVGWILGALLGIIGWAIVGLLRDKTIAPVAEVTGGTTDAPALPAAPSAGHPGFSGPSN